MVQLNGEFAPSFPDNFCVIPDTEISVKIENIAVSAAA